eukprot:GHVT01069939.1.p1 GENE.GHVT01069939.1~~GHVT01069939.1.p1  ORF type:complete len:395 (-),score=109.20 GHVT01069939.1:934-2118(-)
MFALRALALGGGGGRVAARLPGAVLGVRGAVTWAPRHAVGKAAAEADAGPGGGAAEARGRASSAEDWKALDGLFEASKPVAAQEAKVSASGTSRALFAECVTSLRRSLHLADPDVDTGESTAIEDLKHEEKSLLRDIFHSVDPEKKLFPQVGVRAAGIDPYWDPFDAVQKAKGMLDVEFEELAKISTAAQAREHRLALRRRLAKIFKEKNPLADSTTGAERMGEFPKPLVRSDRFWAPDPQRRRVLRNGGRPITWRDVHLLPNFIGENGMMLPRRLTAATRTQQRQLFRAVVTARHLALLPYDWRPGHSEAMPVMDPLQFLADELTHRVSRLGDMRADAMLRVMMEKFPDINYMRFARRSTPRTARAAVPSPHCPVACRPFGAVGGRRTRGSQS